MRKPKVYIGPKPKSRSGVGFNFNPLAKRSKARTNRIDSGYDNWKEVRKKVLERDEYKCRVRRNGERCNRPGNEVHHLIKASNGGRAVMSNLICICKPCHERAPGHKHIRNW